MGAGAETVTGEDIPGRGSVTVFSCVTVLRTVVVRPGIVVTDPEIVTVEAGWLLIIVTVVPGPTIVITEIAAELEAGVGERIGAVDVGRIVVTGMLRVRELL